MIVSNYKSFIFLHIPKSAGSSIVKTIGRYGDTSNTDVFAARTLKHEVARVIREVDPGRFDQYLTFCFVRNPWDRLVSWYFYENKLQYGFSHVFPKFDDFVAYLDKAWEYISLQWEYKMYRVMNDPFVIPLPQTDYVWDGEGRLMVDYVGRFENVREDFYQLMKVLDLQANLTHQNRTVHKTYQEYYTKNTRDVVEKLFRKEISFWDYQFDNDHVPVLHCSERYLQLEQGLQKIDQKKYDEAETHYQKMQAGPFRNLANKRLAQIYYSMGRYGDCLDYGLKMVEACPEDIDGWTLVMKSAGELDNRLLFNQALARLHVYNELVQSSKVSRRQILKSIMRRKQG